MNHRLANRWVLVVLVLLFHSLHGWGAEGKFYALLVGVQGYEHPKLREPSPLQYPVADVTELSDVLKGEGYIVTLMTDESGKQNPQLLPVKAKIETELHKLLQACKKNDTVILAFSGHGLQFTGQKDAYFCPIDARPFLNATDSLVSIAKIYEELDQSFAGVKVILVDACRNDPDPSRGRGLDADTVPPPKGVAALFSCSAGQRAYEDDRLKHGVFFHHVLQGLKGEAANKRGEITFDGLSTYVRQSVPETLEEILPGREQLPNLKADLVGRPPILARVTTPSVPAKPQMEKPRPTRSGTAPPLAISPFNAQQARQHQEAWAMYLGTEVEIENSIGMKLTLIPASEFMMGSEKYGAGDDEKPVHAVRLTKPYFLGTTEVTQGQWETVIGTTPWKGKKNIKEGVDYPATHVSYEDAQIFCRKLSKKEGKEYRLPTEAEWENACRAGTKSTYHFGDNESDLSDYAWWGGFVGGGSVKNEQYPHRVGLKKPNPFGLRDMHGNLCELCSDWYDDKYYTNSPDENPPGASYVARRVLRGGFWLNDPEGCRSANRLWGTPLDRGDSLGFRLARVP